MFWFSASMLKKQIHLQLSNWWIALEKTQKNLLSVLVYVAQNGRARASISHLLLPYDLVFNLIVFYPFTWTREFGGIKNSSITRALLRVIQEWLQAAETPKALIRACLIDFSKAFDHIDHNILIRKLQLLNVPPILLNWCAAFLRNRQQRVKIGQDKSKWLPIFAGVPQGTKLGPLFFLVVIKDLTTMVPIYKYLDDWTVFEETSHSSASSDLQTHLDPLISGLLRIIIMRITKKTKEFNICLAKSSPILQPLTIDNVPLDCVQSTKPLRISIQSNLKWNLHVGTIYTNASKRLFALRCLKWNGVLPRDLCSVFCCFIRPVVEYACPVWHSSLSNALFDELEQIQKRATKIMLPGLFYREQLAHMKLPTLQESRDELCRRFYRTIMRLKTNDVLPPITESVYSFRNARKIPVHIKCRTKRFQNEFCPLCI